jgi:hypothetical protein
VGFGKVFDVLGVTRSYAEGGRRPFQPSKQFVRLNWGGDTIAIELWVVFQILYRQTYGVPRRIRELKSKDPSFGTSKVVLQKLISISFGKRLNSFCVRPAYIACFAQVQRSTADWGVDPAGVAESQKNSC